MTVLVGVDWGDGSHAVCLIDSAGQVLDRFTINHDRQGLGEIRIAIERPSGLLVDTWSRQASPSCRSIPMW
jgi:ribulose kinase